MVFSRHAPLSLHSVECCPNPPNMSFHQTILNERKAARRWRIIIPSFRVGAKDAMMGWACSTLMYYTLRKERILNHQGNTSEPTKRIPSWSYFIFISDGVGCDFVAKVIMARWYDDVWWATIGKYFLLLFKTFKTCGQICQIACITFFNILFFKKLPFNIRLYLQSEFDQIY